MHGEILAPAERAADARQGHPDTLRRQVQNARELAAILVQPLARHSKGHAAVRIRLRETGFRAEKDLVLHADPVLAAHDDLGTPPRPDRISPPDRDVPGDIAGRPHSRRPRIEGGPPRIEHRRQRFVADLDRVQRPAGQFRGLGGDERDRFSFAPHHVLGQHRGVRAFQPVPVDTRHVGVGQDRRHSRQRPRRGGVEVRDARMRMRTAQRGAVQHALGPQIRGVGEGAGHLRDTVGPQRTLAENASVGAGAAFDRRTHGHPSAPATVGRVVSTAGSAGATGRTGTP